MRIYLVGGAVRDLLLNRPLVDRDYLVVDGDEQEFLTIHPTARRVGKSFPVFILDGCEYAWPRGGSLVSDLALRDLTINALAMDTSSDAPGLIHAHPLALTDLAARVLRPASASSISDDPVRAFRAARFAAQLPDFTPAPQLVECMAQAARQGLLAEQTAERVGRETLKALAAPRPGRFLELLDKAGCLAFWFQEMERARSVPAGPRPYHDKDVLGHTIEVMNRLAGDPLAVWMALTHDLGKVFTPPGEWPSHHGHEQAGQAPALALGTRLRLPRQYIEAGATASLWHMQARRYPELRPGTAVDLLTTLEDKRLVRRLFDLVRADSGQDHLPQARRDLRLIRAAHLPEDQRDRGEASGEALRLLRCQSLARARDSRDEA